MKSNKFNRTLIVDGELINQSPGNTSKGELLVENSNGKIVQRSRFDTKEGLLKLIMIFESAPVLIVKFD